MMIKMNKKGFTLIELLIVVAIIAILAAIAIPQFAAYRMRGYNGAAQSDIRNTKTVEESVMAEYGGNGSTHDLVTLAAIPPPAVNGILLTGPDIPATQTVPGSAIGTFIDTDNNNVRDTGVGLGIGLSNLVKLRADVGDAGTTMAALQDFRLTAQHERGNRAFATSSNPTVCVAEDDLWAQVSVGVFEAQPAPNTLPYTQSCAGFPSLSTLPAFSNWVAL